MGARVAFVANASVQTVPAMVERAGQITAAQRARGLDTEGSIWRRLRGVLPIVGPAILGSVAEIEERTMALEARGFTRPGRRTLLWHPPDSGLAGRRPLAAAGRRRDDHRGQGRGLAAVAGLTAGAR